MWLAILAFGSSSKTLINLLFASQYDNWDGFFDVIKEYTSFILPVYFGIALIIACIACLLLKRQDQSTDTGID
jgi:hypothetical protein